MSETVMAEVRWVSVERSDYDENASRLAIGFKLPDEEKLIYANLQFGGETSDKQENYGAMILANLLKGRGEIEVELSEGRNGRTDVFVPRVEGGEETKPKPKPKRGRGKKDEDFPF